MERNIITRLARPDEVAQCLAFERLDEYGKPTPLDVEIMLGCINSKGVLLALHEEIPIGYVALNYIYASRTPFISWLYVSPEYRKIGVAGLLIRALEENLREMGFSRFILSACREQEIARHRKSGLSEIGTLNLGPQEKEIFFEKWF